jgi:hypothetical protein
MLIQASGHIYITSTYGNPYGYFLSGDGNTEKLNKMQLIS